MGVVILKCTATTSICTLQALHQKLSSVWEVLRFGPLWTLRTLFCILKAKTFRNPLESVKQHGKKLIRRNVDRIWTTFRSPKLPTLMGRTGGGGSSQVRLTTQWSQAISWSADANCYFRCIQESHQVDRKPCREYSRWCSREVTDLGLPGWWNRCWPLNLCTVVFCNLKKIFTANC